MSKDKTVLAYDQYSALGIDPRPLAAIVRLTGAVNASSCMMAEVADLPSATDLRTLITSMYAQESAERFSVGTHELVALRFVCNGQPLSMLAIEDYEQPCPVLVDGHTTNRDAAIRAWLGDADASEHPDLYLKAEST